jgi:hypothetical protein
MKRKATFVITVCWFNQHTIIEKLLVAHSRKPQEALNLLVTEERYWALFYIPLYMFIHNLLNVLVQIANKMGLQKKTSDINQIPSVIDVSVVLVFKV